MSKALQIVVFSQMQFRVAIICRPGVVRAANCVTFPTPKAVPRTSFLAALSDILFNKVNHLGAF